MIIETPARPVVVGVDGSTASSAAVTWACAAAASLNRPLHVVHAFVVGATYPGVGGLGPLSVADRRDLEAIAAATLEEAVGSARARAPALTISSDAVSGSAGKVLVDASETAHIVVVGARGLGSVMGLLLGSVSTWTAMHAECPVVVVKGSKDGQDRAAPLHRGGVVVGIDGSANSQLCLDYAFEHAAAVGVPLDVLHAWSLERPAYSARPGAAFAAVEATEQRHQLLLSEALAGWTEKYPDVVLRTSLVHGLAVPALLERAEDAELLVVGSRGRGGVANLVLDSVSHTVLQRAASPVAVVRGRR
ncbi:universal stress protein [Angustibacter sp. McL0619]|uniref:universal stress protein n=1 Tax=Angustibacter sp. McL0619 TaxID=3415676 RepID=UPI003CF632CB